MGFIDFPDPVGMLEGAKTANLEREVVNALMSAAYSSWITFLWRSGSGKWVQLTGEGQALKDAATTAYLSLSALEKKDFLTLTVPSDLLAPDNLSRFQTQEKTK
jgi:hypothetical protein